jgi:hypothetical protein
MALNATGWDKLLMLPTELLKTQFPQSVVLTPPFGKDPGEYFQRGGDLRAWLNSALCGSTLTDPTTHSKIQVTMCRNSKKISGFLQEILNADNPVAMAYKTGPINYCMPQNSIHGNQIKYIAFYFGEDKVIIFDMLKVSSNDLCPVLSSELVTYDGVDALCFINKENLVLKSIHSLMLMDNATRNKSLKSHTGLESIANLVGAVPNSQIGSIDEMLIDLGRQSKLIYDLHSYFKTELEKNNTQYLYELMRSSQLAISQIRLNGFLYKPARKNDIYKQYIDPITNRIRNNTQIAGSITGRFTSSSPSLHNIQKNKKTRSRFISAPGSHFVLGDFNQIQLRIIAELSQDRNMKEIFMR